MVLDVINLSKHELTLIVSEDVRSLAALCQELNADSTYATLDIGNLLSEAMLHISPRQRSTFAARWLEDQMHTGEGSVLVLCNLDLLFEPTLRLDPLSLVMRCSRWKKLIVLWPGSYNGEVLSYAVPEHEHYRIWRRPQVAIYPLKQSRHFQN